MGRRRQSAHEWAESSRDWLNAVGCLNDGPMRRVISKDPDISGRVSLKCYSFAPEVTSEGDETSIKAVLSVIIDRVNWHQLISHP